MPRDKGRALSEGSSGIRDVIEARTARSSGPALMAEGEKGEEEDDDDDDEAGRLLR